MEEDKKPGLISNTKTAMEIIKEVYGYIDFFKKIYNNRAVIARRLNVVTLLSGAIYTLIFTTFLIITTIANKLALSGDMVIYILAGVYGGMALLLLLFVILSSRAKAKSMKVYGIILKSLRFATRVLSIVISVMAIVAAISAEGSLQLLVWDIIMIVLSVFTIIVQLIPLIFGGMVQFIYWLISPAKIRLRFSAVALEWYNTAHTGKRFKSTGKKVDKKYYDAISEIIDNVINPALGKRYIDAIKPAQLADFVNSVPLAQKQITEGVLNSVFAYAQECGYVASDPCNDLHFEGTVEKRTVKEKISGWRSIFAKKKSDDAAVSSDDDG